MGITIKNTSILMGLMSHSFHPILTDIICWVAELYGLVMTESYRPQRHSGDVHSTNPVRAIDLRSWYYDDAQALSGAINAKWQYDPKRPHMKVAIIHAIEGGAEHFHIQVHKNTVRI